MPRRTKTTRRTPSPARAARTARVARPARPGSRAASALRAQAREVYRDAILEAAAEVLVERGYVGTRMQDVAAAAGLAIGTLYNYFPGKDDLVGSLLEHRAAQFSGAIDAVVRDTPARTSLVEGVIRTALGYIETNRALFALFEAGALAGPELGSIQRCNEMQETYRRAVVAALTEARRRGELRPGVALEEASMMLGGMVQGLARSWIATGAKGSLRDRAPLVIDVFLHGVGRR